MQERYVLGINYVAGPVLVHHSNLCVRKLQVRDNMSFVQDSTRKIASELRKVTRTCNPSTWEVGGKSRVQGHLQPHSQIKANLGYETYLKNQWLQDLFCPGTCHSPTTLQSVSQHNDLKA